MGFLTILALACLIVAVLVTGAVRIREDSRRARAIAEDASDEVVTIGLLIGSPSRFRPIGPYDWDWEGDFDPPAAA